MAQRTLPGIGLIGFWDLGYDGWKVENDGNLQLLSALVQASVLSMVAATPGSPTDGDMHIFTAAHPTEPNKLAIRDAGAWVYVTPREGAWVYNQATDQFMLFNGTAWVAGADMQSIIVACSDETTPIAAGTAKVTFRMPYAASLLAIRASLTTAQATNGAGTIFTVDVNEAGATILSTKLTIDNTEKTSVTAATPAVISDADLADDAEITIDVDSVGDGTATGLKVTLIVRRQ